MKKIIIAFLVLFFSVWTEQTFAHKHGHHDEARKDSLSTDSIYRAEAKEISEYAHENGKVTAAWNDFPTLHPLITHFPIVLLLIAALLQLAGLFIFKNEMSWIVMFLTVGGFIGAHLSAYNFHPHTEGLNDMAAKVLKVHEEYANYTMWFSGIAAMIKIVSQFILKRKLFIEIAAAASLLASAYCVSMAGHHGAQLVHIEGIGPQGKYLESHHDDH